MHGFWRALAAELHLAARSRGLQALILVPPLCAASRIALAALAGAGEQARAAFTGKPGAAVLAVNAYGPFVDGLVAGLTIGGLLLGALAAYLIASRRELGCLRQPLILRSSRAALVVASFAFLVAAALLSLALVILASWGAAACCHDFGPVVEDGYEILGTAELHAEIRRGLLLGAAPLPATLALGVLIGLAARSAAGALGSMLGALLLVDFFKGLLGKAALYLPMPHQPSLFDRSYLADVAKLARGYSDVLVEESNLRLNAIVPLPWTVVFLALAVAVASRRRL